MCTCICPYIYVYMYTGTTPKITASAPARWRLIGCGMGGGIAAHAAASDVQFAASLDAIVFFEPHAFFLLGDPRCGAHAARTELAGFEAFAHSLLALAAAGRWDDWGHAYSRFYLSRPWDALDERHRALLRAHAVPSTHEAMAILGAWSKTAEAQSPKALDSLKALRCPKHIVMSASPGAGCAGALTELCRLLQQHAGFTIHTAPEGGQQLLSMHPNSTMPLLAACLLDVVPELPQPQN